MSQTIFSKIIAGEIPSYKVYEDEHVLAFLDISQVTKGHTLVIPKKAATNIFEIDEENMTHLAKALPRVAKAIKQAFNPLGLNILQNNDAYAGQSVFHIHFHLIPRYDEQDGFNLHWQPQGEHYTPQQMSEISQKIKEAL